VSTVGHIRTRPVVNAPMHQRRRSAIRCAASFRQTYAHFVVEAPDHVGRRHLLIHDEALRFAAVWRGGRDATGTVSLALACAQTSGRAEPDAWPANSSRLNVSGLPDLLGQQAALPANASSVLARSAAPSRLQARSARAPSTAATRPTPVLPERLPSSYHAIRRRCSARAWRQTFSASR
jgi:hypothetical protein